MRPGLETSRQEDILENRDITQQLEDNPAPGGRLSPGMTLANRYQIDGVLGVGGMGSVFRARDLHFPSIMKMVAVKEMLNQPRDENLRPLMIQNFEREANIIATLNHPAVPRIYDFFIQGENAYLVLELIQGKDLEAIIQDLPGFLPEDEVIRWAIELCDVLDYLHNHNPEPIIFRDLKPSNVMINEKDHVVLVDFGIAKNFRIGQRGTMMGTEGYSPPEQYRGEASPIVDIYALGATLHHLLTKADPRTEAPFTFNERPIHRYNQGISPELEEIISKAVEYQPESRYQSALEMKAAFEGLKDKPQSRLPAPVPQVKPVSRSQDRCVWRFQCEDEIRGTPAYDNGIVYVGSLDNNLYALDAVNGRFLWKVPSRGGIVCRPAVQDSFVYFGSEDGGLYSITAATGRAVWSYATGKSIRSSPRLSENYVYIGSDDASLHCVNINTGQKVWRMPAGAPIRSTVLIHENLIYMGTEAGDLFCVNLFGETKWHFRAKRAITSSPAVSGEILVFASMDGSLYALDAKNGWEVWRYRMGKGAISSPDISGSLVYVGSVDGAIYAVDINNGWDAWTYRTEHQVTGSPLVYEEAVYCGSVDGNLYCLDARTGQLVWKFGTGKPITGAPVIAGSSLFFGSTDRNLYALEI